ncbi:hypothetical protein ACB092_11G012100 [Castanea dentata]
MINTKPNSSAEEEEEEALTISEKMGGHRCCSKQKVKRGLWSPEEDEKLVTYITAHGLGSWSSVPKFAGLQRCGKSCRLRWINYLRPDLKRGTFTSEEEQIIIDVHRIVGNKWAQIAKHLPGRTDNEVKNFWNSCIKKKLISQGLDPNTHNLIPSHQRASKKVACNVPPNHQQPNSVFTLNSQFTDASTFEMKTPIITVPEADQPPLLQSPNLVWNQGFTDFSSFPHVSSVESTPNISSSSSSSLNLSGFGVLNHENCVWGANTLEPFEAPGLEGEQYTLTQPQQEKDKVSEMLTNKVIHQPMDTSFDGSSFDLGFVESSLMSDIMYDDLSSMDDFAWN